jgi:tetratricopeptide (TPR) repeat protein
MSVHVSPEAVEAVQAFVRARDWDDSRAIFEAHSEALMTDDAENILAGVWAEHVGDERRLLEIEIWRALVARARREGIDAAYEHVRRFVAANAPVKEAWATYVTPSVGVCREALALVDGERQPVTQALDRFMLAVSLVETPAEDRAGALDEAIESFQAALPVLAHARIDGTWVNGEQLLAVAALHRAGLRRNAADIELAVESFLRVGFFQERQAEPQARRESFDAALEAFEQAARFTTRDNPRWAERRSLVADAHRARFDAFGDAADLDAAIETLRGAAEGSSEDAERGRILSQLGANLNDRFEARGDRDDLDAAIVAHEKAIRLVPEDDPRRSLALGNEAIALHTRFVEEHDPRDLERSIEGIRIAVAGSEEGSVEEGRWQGNLGVGLRSRFSLLGDAADLDAAADALRAAVEREPGAGRLALWLYDSGLVALSRFELTADERDADEAITAFEQSLEHVRESSRVRVMCQRDLGVARRRKFELFGRTEDVQAALKDLATALTICRPGTPDFVRIEGNLAGAYSQIGRKTGSREPFDLAIKYFGMAMAALPEGAPLRAELETDLGGALAGRHALTGDEGDSRAAAEALERAISYQPEAWPEQVLLAARHLGPLLGGRGDWRGSARALEQGVAALDALYRRQLLRSTREAWLVKGGIVHADAAYAHAQMGDAKTAAVLLERGRGRILSDALARGRADLRRLAQAGHSELVERYRLAAARLAALERAGAEDPSIRVGDELRDARAAIERAIAEIRSLEGYEAFLEPPTFEEIAAAASADPLAYVVGATLGGLALIVRPGGEVTTAWLPELTLDAVVGEATGFVSAYRIRRRAPGAWAQAVDDVTEWLWDAGMGPLLEALEPADRATLVPGGLLGLLPLHAAWRPENGSRRYALDDVLLTYAPTARALNAAASRAARRSDEALLAVDEPRPVTAAPLPHASREVEAVRSLFAGGRRLRREQATRKKVLEALDDSTVLHFACHARADLFEPLASGLLLAGDEALTLHDLIKQQLDARLAVLSACETAVPGIELPDEVVSLPSGFLQAGAAGIVGSLWSVPDASTMALMTRFYELWRSEAPDPAAALRSAQRWLRDATNGEKSERFPENPELSGASVSAGRKLWELGHAHEHPRFWAGFAYFGV